LAADDAGDADQVEKTQPRSRGPWRKPIGTLARMSRFVPFDPEFPDFSIETSVAVWLHSFHI